jgi:L-fucose isomerase-like protein
MAKAVLGVIYGNRDFFPDRLVAEARADMQALFDTLDLEGIALDEGATKMGGVETYADAARCAELFRAHRERIDGILVVLPNFGDEKGVADAIRLSELAVPILVQAYPDDPDQLHVERRRDAYCGKISVCNNLVQRRVPFTLTRRHVVAPQQESFRRDLLEFVALCRVVNRLRKVRIGAVGARPGAFNTVRYSEKILEANGISVTTIDLSDVLAQVAELDGDAAEVRAKGDEIAAYAASGGVPADKLALMAKLGVVLERWMGDHALDATAIQCWTSMQRNLGINACALMSMMSEGMLPSACEVDVTGVLTMYAMQLASGGPAALVDWNNNYGDDPDKCVLFHCGNWAKSFVPDAEIATAPILGTVVGVENTYGALEGRTPSGPLTFGRLSTNDRAGAERCASMHPVFVGIYVPKNLSGIDRCHNFGPSHHFPVMAPILRRAGAHVHRGPGMHPVSCALENEESGYGIIVDGKFLRFDDHGNRQARLLLKATQKGSNLKVRVGGHFEGELIKVSEMETVE